MRARIPILLLTLGLALSQSPDLATAQGKGGGKGQGGGQSEGKGRGGGKGQEKVKGQGRAEKQVTQERGRADDVQVGRGAGKGIGKGVGRAEKGKSESARNKFTRLASLRDIHPSVRGFANRGRAQDVILATAVSHAFARGRGDDFRIDQDRNGLRIANRKGDRLVFLDDESARNLGRWRVDVFNDNVRGGAPSFCRSGAGHPVWGRQWCVDKGFGLASYQDFRWGYTNDLGDVVFSRGSLRDRLLGTALEAALGTRTFNRLALHAVTLGLVEPLTGTWYTEPAGPQLMMVNSGTLPVAEFVDVNRDYRPDLMLVALRPW